MLLRAVCCLVAVLAPLRASPVTAAAAASDVPPDPLHALAARCGREIDWAPTWEEAARRARLGRRPIFVRVRLYEGFALSDARMVDAFMDPDVVALLNERYVAFDLGKGEPAPLLDPERYGIGPLGFGEGLLLCTPDGRVVADAVGDVEAFLLDGLDAIPELPGPPAPALRDPLDRVENLLRRGELLAARDALGAPASARGFLLLAAIERRGHDGEAALAALASARAAEGHELLAVDIALDEAYLLLRAEREADARALLVRVLDESPEHHLAPRARFLLGAAELALGDAAAARAHWEALVADVPSSRWAWQAAGVLTSTALALGGAGSWAWPDAQQRDAERVRTRAPLPPEQAARARDDAIAWLLAHQRADGSWATPAEGAATDGVPNDLTLAITALCTQALLPHRADPVVARAVALGLDATRRLHERAAAIGPYGHFLDYGAWSRAYVLWLLADAVELELLAPADVATDVERLAGDLRARRKPAGGWSYYVTTDLLRADPVADATISFTTAAVVLALVRAGEAGLDVPSDLLEGGLDALASLHVEGGVFAYMALPGPPAPAAAPGAAGRAPVCARALWRGGRLARPALADALALHVEHLPALVREQGKSIMHAGRDGQGSHYVLFDAMQAAAALAALGPTERARWRDAILSAVLAARYADGAFLDNPLVGPASGTGLALMALDALLDA